MTALADPGLPSRQSACFTGGMTNTTPAAPAIDQRERAAAERDGCQHPNARPWRFHDKDPREQMVCPDCAGQWLV